MLRNLENKGNPWGMSASARADWTEGLDFEVPGGRPGRGSRTTSSTCSGSAARAPSRTGPRRRPGRSPSCCTPPGSSFAVLGAGETCTGDPARRLGNEFLYQMLAQQNVETLNERRRPQKIVATCPHCFNTLANEYPQLGGNYEVVHHTQLLGRLVDEGRLTPGARRSTSWSPTTTRATWAGTTRSTRRRARCSTPCPGLRSAGDAPLQGARLLLRRRRRPDVDGGEDRQADQRRAHRRGAGHWTRTWSSTACPYCMVMLGDAVTAKKQAGSAREDVEVLDVAQLTLRSVHRNITVVPVEPTRRHPGRACHQCLTLTGGHRGRRHPPSASEPRVC